MAEKTQKPELVQNGLPRVMWLGEARGKRFRVVLVEESDVPRSSPRCFREGEALLLEALCGLDGMRAERWELVGFDKEDDSPIWAFATFAAKLATVRCSACGDSGCVVEPTATGRPGEPCWECERGQQMAFDTAAAA